jgi:hypothetical protein
MISTETISFNIFSSESLESFSEDILDTIFSTAGFLADDSSADGFLADGFLADGFLADGFLADGFLADGFLADGFLADGFLADGSLTDSSEDDLTTLAVIVSTDLMTSRDSLFSCSLDMSF